jgi:adenosylcobinamide-GDP ribazoletransferase
MWSRAITLAPLIGAALGALAWCLAWGIYRGSGSALLAATTAPATLALLTRGLHLDGLADVADGLGSRKTTTEARAIMRRSDIGPFGVVTVTFTLFVQVAAVAVALGASAGVCAIAVIGGAAIGRTAMLAASRRGVPAAADGLGAQVVGVVTPVTAAVLTALMVILTVFAGLAITTETGIACATACLMALLVGEWWWRHCARRLGAVTGDVLGSIEELAFTCFVLVLAVAV